jgi:hypothetical protein
MLNIDVVLSTEERKMKLSTSLAYKGTQPYKAVLGKLRLAVDTILIVRNLELIFEECPQGSWLLNTACLKEHAIR